MTILFTFFATILVAIGIIKKYYPQAVLTIGGMLILLAGYYFGDIAILETSTGSVFIDLFTVLKNTFSKQMSGLGLTIMSVAGFAAYMSHIGASQALVRLSVKPVSMISSPWIVLAFSYFVGIFAGLFVTSATGLGLLLMVTLYPIMRSAGISKASAVGVIATTQAFEIGHTQSNVIAATDFVNEGLKKAHALSPDQPLELIDPTIYAVSYQLPIILAMLLTACVLHIWWQRRCDMKDGWDPYAHKGEQDDNQSDDINMTQAPTAYALLTIIPFILLLVFSKLFISSVKLHIVVAMLIPAVVGMFVEAVRKKSLLTAFDGWKIFLEGMGSVFASVVALIVGAKMFGDALVHVKAIDAFLNFAGSLGVGGVFMIVVVVALIVTASILMGSGNASFFSFAGVAPDIAVRLGIAPIAFLLPMQIASSIGRSMSPIAAVVVATAGIAKLSPIDVVKRTIVPMGGSLIVGVTLAIILNAF